MSLIQPGEMDCTEFSQVIFLTKFFTFEFFKQIPLRGHSPVCPGQLQQLVHL